MKLIIVLICCLFIQTSYALEAGRYAGVIESVKSGNVEISNITLIAYITTADNNGNPVFFIEFYNPEQPHKARTSLYQLMVENSKNNDIWKFGHFKLVEQGKFDVVTTPISFSEQFSHTVPPLKVLFSDGSYVILQKN